MNAPFIHSFWMNAAFIQKEGVCDTGLRQRG
jgi:hypothetical protein